MLICLKQVGMVWNWMAKFRCRLLDLQVILLYMYSYYHWYSLFQAVVDMSPYVRKTAAHGIPKLYVYGLHSENHFIVSLLFYTLTLLWYRLAPSEKENLIELIEKLLCDKTHVSIAADIHTYIHTHIHAQLVLGSIVMAFEEVCPERLDLIHKHYRKLCNVLVCTHLCELGTLCFSK